MLKRLLAAAGAGIALSVFAAPGFTAVAAGRPPIGDTCLVGRWIATRVSAPGNWTWSNEVLPVTGLAGLVVEFRSEGVQVINLNAAQPLVGDYHGHQVRIALRGTVAYHAHADGRLLALNAPAVDVQVAFFYDGVLQPGGTVNYASSATDSYSCSPTHLTIQSQAVNAGFGPEVDEFTRPQTAVGSPVDQPGSVVSTVGSTLARPSALVASPVTLLVSALATLALVLLVTFPSHLFNRTFEENHDLMRQWWERRVWWLQRVRRLVETRRKTGATGAASFIAVVLAGGVLAALLDPHFGPNPRTAALFAGAAFALLAGGLVSAGSGGLYRALRGNAGPWHLHALPSGLVVAALCVLVSRLTAFQPGYLYGLIGGIVFSRSLSRRQEGHVVAVSSIATMIVAFAAWLVWVPVSTISSSSPTSFGWAVASNFLAALFVSGMVGLLIGLIPLRFLPGEKLAGWHRGVWGAVFGLAALSVIEIMLRPQSAGAHVAGVPFWTTAGLFVAFGAASILFWSFFRLRKTDVRTRRAPVLTMRKK